MSLTTLSPFPPTTATALLISSIRVSVHTARPFNTLALLLLPLLCAIGLIGNAFVCVAIATDRRLHNVTNYFLFSLALADLLVCCIVMPLSIVVEVRHGVWTWNFSMCLLYVYADVFLCSASIVHMSVISLDRYLGISQPLKTRNKSKTLIFLKIALVWVVTVLISSPLAVVALHDPSNVLQENSCMIFNRTYMIYGSTLSFLIPFLIMTMTYVRTTSLLNKQAKVLNEKVGTNGTEGLRRTMPNHRKLGYCSSNGGNGVLKRYQSMGEQEMEQRLLLKNKAVSEKTAFARCISAFTSRVATKKIMSAELANEHKATRVLAVVFVCFFICWTPFFIANFTYGFCGEKCELPPWMGSVFLWLGYISSTINPLIYTIFNKRFRQAFVRILRCQCLHSLRDPYSFYSRHTTILPDTYYTCLLPLVALPTVPSSNTEQRVTSKDEAAPGGSINKDPTMRAPRTVREGQRSITIDGPLPPAPPPRPVPVVRRSMTMAGPLKINFDSPLPGRNKSIVTSYSDYSSHEMTEPAAAQNGCPVISTARASLMETSTTTTTSCSSSTGISPSLILFNAVFSRHVRETFL